MSMQADCEWPFGHEGEAPAVSDDPIVRGIYELAARQEYDRIKQWHADRSKRFDEASWLDWDELVDDIEQLQLKPETRRKYAQDWARFCKFVEGHVFEGAPLQHLPACGGLVALFLLQELVAGKSYGSLRRQSAAISEAHWARGFPDPAGSTLVRAALQYAKRNAGHFKAKQQQQPVGPFSDEEAKSDEQQQ